MIIIKKILSVLLILIISTVILYILFLASFSYMTKNKSSREELEKNYYEHKNEFIELVSLFDTVIPQNYKNHNIFFGNGDNDDQFHLMLMPYDEVINDSNFLGGENLEVGSAKLDSVLYELKWDKTTLTFLSERLRIINCSKITTEPTHKSYFIISSEDGGSGVYTYRIFKQPLTDSLFKIYGEPVGKNGFDRKVVIHYDTPF